jgi:hypothetical protein
MSIIMSSCVSCWQRLTHSPDLEIHGGATTLQAQDCIYHLQVVTSLFV